MLPDQKLFARVILSGHPRGVTDHACGQPFEVMRGQLAPEAGLDRLARETQAMLK
jgi:hypothetical protein